MNWFVGTPCPRGGGLALGQMACLFTRREGQNFSLIGFLFVKFIWSNELGPVFV